MSDTRINPVSIATAAVAGAAVTAAGIATKNYAAKKIAALPADTFVKKTAKNISNGWTSFTSAIKKRINKQTFTNAWGWVKGKFLSAKDTVVKGLSNAKQAITKKTEELAAKPVMKKIIGFAKNPLVIGAAIGVLAFIGVSKLLDKINDR